MALPPRTIERLCCYRRSLQRLLADGQTRIYSHQLAAGHDVTPAQVRRDLMTIRCSGSPARGYEVQGLLARIGEILDPEPEECAILLGVGHLGRALLAYFATQGGALRIAAAFDTAPDRSGVVIHGCRCHSFAELEAVIAPRRVTVALLAVPADAAQEVATRLVRAGVRSIVNFAPVQLDLPLDVYVETIDIAVSMEKAAFFSRVPSTTARAQPPGGGSSPHPEHPHEAPRNRS